MDLVTKLDNELYSAIKNSELEGNNIMFIWNKIKKNSNLLMEAAEIKIDENGNKTLKAKTICDFIATYHRYVDYKSYLNLARKVLANQDIARMNCGHNKNTNYSLLLKILNNFNLRLTKEQKDFAVAEAVQEHFHNTHFHVQGPFDLRLLILENPNWTSDEKANLVYDFYLEEEEFHKTLKELKQFIVDTLRGLTSNNFDAKEVFHSMTEHELLSLINFNENDAIPVWKQICLVRFLENLRPQNIKVRT